MSSRVKKIRENVENKKKLEAYTLYGSLIGSVIVTVGKLVGMDEDAMIKHFVRFSKDSTLFECKNIREVCEYVIKVLGMDEKYKDNIVLVFDDNNLYTPLVTLEVNGNILPLDRNCIYNGILQHLGEDNIGVEYIFEEEDQ